ncbi:isoleucine--tRNA ligase [Fimbriimonas ginsengisoli]|uniref:Isoleucine--tRNA ligase n=1 Tax=Fimbriimonas ginsengisoli Gsoil 348 TaxID=661478 RepID=A0A068NIP7_FIMGI|nr:isoleucine--tRNA ligase [Fimbriimonas ginsengisoli]AIE83473.1 isoleucyl-tRNA synthetase [Fimbriimonas ginsengisoli Gsoil 348]
MDLRSTLNLPDPNFTIPMKADLPKLEPTIQARWEAEGIYHRIQETRKDAPSFVLHDGPPYTNSPIHIGTALNKILKDLVVKSRTMMGFRAPYVPGYDNHGLPIEQTVMKKFQERKVTPSVVELRKACREHAAQYVDVQTSQFKRLGVFGLWERPYATMDYRFEAEIVRTFKRMVEGGYVYKGLRPTLWSPTSRTALADTEIVYHPDHVSKAIYVAFPLREDPNQIFAKYPCVDTIIWTTTPWTIPANLAVAFHPTLEYAVVAHWAEEGVVPPVSDTSAEQAPSTYYVVLHALVPRIADALGWKRYEVVERFDGITLDGASFSHPIFDRPSIAVMAEYVTTEDGTGVVHTAPSHGRDDFYTGQKYGLPVPNTVDERGVLTSEAGEFEGIYYKECDTVVVDRLREVGALLDVRDHVHSYPYAERDDKPVIFRATEQWFVAIDHNFLRDRMLQEIASIPLEEFTEHPPQEESKGVSWVPESGYNRIEAMVKNRPDWCISRQRPWGVGIPIFYGAKTRTPVLDPVAIESVARLVEREGSDAWFVTEPDGILPAGYTHPETGETEFTKETDVLDVWFDSGSTSLCVLEGNVYPEWKEHWPADVYLEGSDQHRGWFNSSLVIGTATRGAAPYRQVVTHGFVTDSEGRKMSKRLGNVVDPVEACEKYGADIIRIWVANVDYANDVPCTDALLKQLGEQYRTVRNTLRFLLGNLQGFDASVDVPLIDIDEWIVEQTELLVADCVESYRRYDFNTVITAVHNFCGKELSRFYLDAIKDRMYCEAPGSAQRQSGQAACRRVLLSLLKLVAPILVHTAEETWTLLRESALLDPGEPETVHAATFDPPSAERLAEIEGSSLQVRFAVLKAVRDDVFAAFEPWKSPETVKDSQDAIASVTLKGQPLETLRTFETYELANLFKMSWVELNEGEPSVSFRRSEFLKCDRSRLRRPDVETVVVDGAEISLTRRDRAVLGV